MKKARLVRRTRALLGFTQAQFASVLHVTPKTVSVWETGRRSPPMWVLDLLWVALSTVPASPERDVLMDATRGGEV
jgi:DNA-binding transcriptional regulator YiaG